MIKKNFLKHDKEQIVKTYVDLEVNMWFEWLETVVNSPQITMPKHLKLYPTYMS